MKNHTKAYLSYIFICIVWGTTYLGIRIAVLHYPPFLMAGVRQLSSGIILGMVAMMLNRHADWSRKHVLRQVLAGFLLITAGNGLVTWAEQYVSSGVAALICSTMPISAVLINILKGREKLNMLILAGMLLGFGGVALIFCDNLRQAGNNSHFVMGIVALVVATLGWALGSIMNKRTTPAVNVLMDSGIQVAAGGCFMLLISPAADDYSRLVLFNKDGLLALAYLIIFGSVLAYAAYMYALKELPVGFVTSYAYVNPLVAVILGSLFLDEALNQYTIFAFLLIISGIVTVRSGYKKQEKLNAISE